MTQAHKGTFRERSIQALNDDQLRHNFKGAMEFLQNKRRSVFSDEVQAKLLRTQAHQIKARALSQLPELLERLESNLIKNGIQVHWAETTEQACQAIYDIVKANQGEKLVKGKSMVSEEIGLNHYLEARGIECVETDMGEYIVQLAKETPSHIIMPAIHKSKEEIAQLFVEHIPNVPYTENVDELIGIGRRVLRDKFEQADIGLSGVNFAVAETGTLCLVENEGNGRMCTTVPRIHIALTGIEKVIEKLSDLPPLLSLLTRSATGQTITTYFNMISRPRQVGEKDGPEQVHLVLLDNGRSRMFQDQELQQTLRCIRCGACMNHCPVYSRIGGHAYGTVYPGPIGQVVSPQILGIQKAGEITEGCTLNAACGEVCPVEIPLPDLIRRLREERNLSQKSLSNDGNMQTHPLGAGSQRKWQESILWWLWKQVYSNEWLYRFVARSLTRLHFLTPNRIPPWTDSRKAPKFATITLHDLMKQRASSPGVAKRSPK